MSFRPTLLPTPESLSSGLPTLLTGLQMLAVNAVLLCTTCVCVLPDAEVVMAVAVPAVIITAPLLYICSSDNLSLFAIDITVLAADMDDELGMAVLSSNGDSDLASENMPLA